MYNHESEERKPNAHPMCTYLPVQAVEQNASDKMTDYLYERNLNVGLARENGWYPSQDAGDKFLRIVIPAVMHKAGHVYWQARDITGKAFIRYQSPQGPRHEALIAVHPRLDMPPRGNVIVEGPMDAIAAAGEGCYSIALMGMHPSQATLHHLALLLDEQMPTIVLLDRDSTNEAVRIVAWLASQEFAVQMASLPGPEKDLAECLPEKRSALLQRYIPRRYFQHNN